MPRVLTKSQINKLGDRLRKEEPIGEDTLARLQEFRKSYEEPLAAVQARITTVLGIEATSRLKTVTTIVEKLRREKTRLAEMQDIAGLRLSRRMTLVEQDELVARVVATMRDARVVDRRAAPVSGYRAVHVIVKEQDLPVEIQVRTDLQDAWAQIFESFADEVGRDVRYGLVLDGPLGQLQALLEKVSNLVATNEGDDLRLSEMQKPGGEPEAWPQRQKALEDLVRSQREATEEVQAILADLAKFVGVLRSAQ